MPSFLFSTMIRVNDLKAQSGGNNRQRLAKLLKAKDFVESKGTTLSVVIRGALNGFSATVVIQDGLGDKYALDYHLIKKPNVATTLMQALDLPMAESLRGASDPCLLMELQSSRMIIE